MTQWVKTLAAKANNLSLIPKTSKVEGENQLEQVILWSPLALLPHSNNNKGNTNMLETNSKQKLLLAGIPKAKGQMKCVISAHSHSYVLGSCVTIKSLQSSVLKKNVRDPSLWASLTPKFDRWISCLWFHFCLHTARALSHINRPDRPGLYKFPWPWQIPNSTEVWFPYL